MYLAVCACVNRRIQRPAKPVLPWVGTGLFACTLVMACGCISAPISDIYSGSQVDPMRADDGAQRVGVCYSLENALRASATADMDLVERDFENMRQMGIDAVLVRHVPLDGHQKLVEIAESHGPNLIWPDVQAMNRVGGIPQHPSQRKSALVVPGSPVITGHYLGHVVDNETLARAKTEANRVRRSRLGVKAVVRVDSGLLSPVHLKAFDCIIAHDPANGSPENRTPTVGGMQILRCGGSRGGESAQVRGWLLAYHRGLGSGRTAGVIIEDFRNPPGDDAGLVSESAPLSPERISMIQRIASRAKRWSKMLNGLSPTNVTELEGTPASVEVALLARGARRCVLIINASTVDFARGEVALPVELNGEPVVHAVAIPAESAGVLGDVIRARTDRIVFPVTLAPGDAELFELF